jgi:UPF0755 protein
MNMKKKTIIIVSVLVFIVLAAGCFLAKQYYHITKSNFTSIDEESHAFYVMPETSIETILDSVMVYYEMKSKIAWKLTCELKEFNQVKPGHYKFPAKFSAREIVNRLQYGKETPINLSFTQSIRTREQLAAQMGKKLLLDSADVKTRLDNAEYMAKFGLTPETAVCMFIPNTYEVYWTMSADQLFERMHKEYNRFWNEERIAKAKKLGFTPTEVVTIGSIIASETNKSFEYPTIASIYINRVRKGIPLQACPTVIFAVGDFTMRRVLNRHLAIDSPYNTYMYKGLPPGPIRVVRPDILDAVLNAPETDYLFMCANPDFSGTHIFSSTYSKHQAIARRYQQELNKRQIK